MKNLKITVKVLLVSLFMTSVSVNSFAQEGVGETPQTEKKAKKSKDKKEKELKRPEKVNNAGTDAFVASSFDLYEKNQAITKQLSDAANSIGDAGQIKTDLEGQMKEVTGLLGKAGDVMKGAKAITPKTDSMKAVKALNAATKALNKTKEAIPSQLEQIKAQDSGK